MIGIVVAVCAICLLCLLSNTTRLIGLAGIVCMAFLYPISIIFTVLLFGAFFLFTQFL